MLDNFTIGDVVTLKGLNKRGLDRVNNFGPKFTVKSFEVPSREGCILFEAVDKSFRVGETLQRWAGWLDKTEVAVDEIHRDTNITKS